MVEAQVFGMACGAEDGGRVVEGPALLEGDAKLQRGHRKALR
ncbi:hypothetical protein ACH40E_39900 [Streptomyces acidicola]